MNIASKSEKRAPMPTLKGIDEPQNIEAEVAILGGILIDSIAYDRAAEVISSRHFYLGYHGQIFAAMTALRSEQHPIDLVSVTTKAIDLGVKDAQSLVSDLIDRVPSATNIDYHAELVYRKWQLRETIRISREAIQTAYEPGATPEAVRLLIQGGLEAIAEDSRGSVVTIADAVAERLGEIETRCETGEMPFVPTGIPDLDKKLKGGTLPGKLIVIAGRPGMGKSALGVSNLLPAIAQFSGKASIVFSLEMGRDELVDRFLCRHLTHPWQLSAQNFKSIDWEELGRVGSAVSALPIFIDDRPGVTYDQIVSTCRRLRAEQGEIGCIVIDYLQIMGGLSDSGNAVLEIGRVANGLKNLARELNTTIILLSQLNRSVEARPDKRPTSADLRQSGAIEEAADIVLMVYRDIVYNPDTEDREIAELILTKQRGGDIGTVKTIFDGARSAFTPIARPATPKPIRVEIPEDCHDF